VLQGIFDSIMIETNQHGCYRLETTIEKELLERLRKGVYGDGILNESQEAFTKALDALGQEQDMQSDLEQELEFEEEEDDIEQDTLDREFVSDFDTSSDEEDVDEKSILEEDSDEESQDSDSSAEDSESDPDTKENKVQKKKVVKSKHYFLIIINFCYQKRKRKRCLCQG
jgi:protein MAK16